MSGTNIYYLSGLPKNNQSIWLGNDPYMSSAGKLTILSSIDVLLVELKVTKDKKRLIHIYNQLDTFSLLLYGYEKIAKGDKELFVKVAKQVAFMSTEKYFSSGNIDLSFRKSNLEQLKNTLNNRLKVGYKGNRFDIRLYNWIIKEVVSYMDTARISGEPDWVRENQIIRNTKKSAHLYLYRFIRPNERKYYKEVAFRKLNGQNRIFNWVVDNNDYFTTTTHNNLVRSGIIENSNMTPEQLLRYMRVNGVGFDEMANEKRGSSIGFLGTVLTVIGIVSGLITIYQQLWGTKRDAPSDTEIEQSLPEGSDTLKGNNKGNNNGASGSKTGTNGNKSEVSNENDNSKATFITKNIPLFTSAGILFFLFKKH